MTSIPGLSREQIDELAEYNARVAKGIVHTIEYAERMRHLQSVFDERDRLGPEFCCHPVVVASGKTVNHELCRMPVGHPGTHLPYGWDGRGY